LRYNDFADSGEQGERMNIVSEFVKSAMLNYPTLYPTRFKALFGALIGNTGYTWDKDGNLFPDSQGFLPEKEATEKSGEYFQGRKDRLSDCMDPQIKLHAAKDLLDFEFMAENIDLLADDKFHAEHQEVSATLNSLTRYFPKYGALFERPENISEEWRMACRELLSSFFPVMNSLWGVDKENKWYVDDSCSEAQKDVWETLHQLYTDLESAEDRAKDEWCKELIKKMKEEE